MPGALAPAKERNNHERNHEAKWPEYPALSTAGLDYFVGLDLGQARDYTAAAIVERRETLLPGRDPATWEQQRRLDYLVRWAGRLPLGTPYLEVAERVGHLVRSSGLAGRCSLVVDATGVGCGVVELLRRARLGCPLVPVTITGGIRPREDEGMWLVPKKDLVVGVQLMLEAGELAIAGGIDEGETLVKELRNMRVKIGVSGHETFEAWREGGHDDLVLAVSLACWWGKRKLPARRKRPPL